MYRAGGAAPSRCHLASPQGPSRQLLPLSPAKVPSPPQPFPTARSPQCRDGRSALPPASHLQLPLLPSLHQAPAPILPPAAQGRIQPFPFISHLHLGRTVGTRPAASHFGGDPTLTLAGQDLASLSSFPSHKGLHGQRSVAEVSKEGGMGWWFPRGAQDHPVPAG